MQSRRAARYVAETVSQTRTARLITDIWHSWYISADRLRKLRESLEARRDKALRGAFAVWRQRHLIARAVARLMHVRFLNNAQLLRLSLQAWRDHVRGIGPAQDAITRRNSLNARLAS